MVHFRKGENTQPGSAESGSPWYETEDPAAIIAWARDHLVKDLEETADDLRREASFIDGKASLLFDMMSAVAKRLSGGVGQ